MLGSEIQDLSMIHALYAAGGGNMALETGSYQQCTQNVGFSPSATDYKGHDLPNVRLKKLRADHTNTNDVDMFHVILCYCNYDLFMV